MTSRDFEYLGSHSKERPTLRAHLDAPSKQTRSMISSARRSHAAIENIGRLQKRIGRFASADDSKALQELGWTLAILCVGFSLSCFARNAHWLIYFATVLVSGVALVRAFTIQHDCGHGSFFSSKSWNKCLGRVISVLTFFPYAQWRSSHAEHHKNVGNLDSRGVGDIRTITRAEFDQLPWRRQVLYRLYRNPAILILVGGPFYVLIRNRFPRGELGRPTFERWTSALSLNLCHVVIGIVLWRIDLLEEAIQVVLPAVAVGGSIGVVFFFFGHQFQGTAWSRPPHWSLIESAFRGSSYLELPEPCAWLTGYVGVHHVHHLNSRIPLYRLKECLQQNPELAQHNRLTLIDAVKGARLMLWDEGSEQLVGLATRRRSPNARTPNMEIETPTTRSLPQSPSGSRSAQSDRAPHRRSDPALHRQDRPGAIAGDALPSRAAIREAPPARAGRAG